MDACLLICNIYSTVSDLKFLQEDNISHIIKFAQFQLRETIFPLHDPVYTVKSVKKSNQRKKTKSHQNHHRSLQMFYSKVVELLKVFVALFDKCIFVDTIVLPLSTLAIEPFFVDNIETLQFVCLELVTTVSLYGLILLRKIPNFQFEFFRYFVRKDMRKYETVS